MVAEQTIFNNQSLDVSGKINALADLAKQYGDVTTAALASAAAQKADAYARAMATDEGASYSDSVKKYLESTYNDLVNSVNNFNPISYAPKINYGGGATTKSAKDAANKTSKEAEKTFSKFFDWMERRIERLSKLTEKAVKKITDSISYAMDKSFISSAFKKINKEMQYNMHMAESYQKHANSVGLGKARVNLIKGGGKIDFSTITDEGLANQIDSYQEYYDKAQDAIEATEELRDTIKEVAEAMAQAPIEKYAKKIEKYESSTEVMSGMGVLKYIVPQIKLIFMKLLKILLLQLML